MRTILLACLALSGCATGLMKEDASSLAVRSVMAAQVIDPAGVRETGNVTGLDGRAARKAQERYEKSFGAEPSSTGTYTELVK